MRGWEGVGEGSGGRRRGEGEKRRWEMGKNGEKGKEGKRGNFALSMRGRRIQGFGSGGGGGVEAYPLSTLMYVEVCSVYMSFYAHANTL